MAIQEPVTIEPTPPPTMVRYELLPAIPAKLAYGHQTIGTRTDLLTGAVEQLDDVAAQITVGTQRYSIRSGILWHDHGGGSASSIQYGDAPLSITQAMSIAERHARNPEDPCSGYFGQALVRPDDTGKVHTLAYRTSEGDIRGDDIPWSMCGRDLTGMIRVMRSTVPGDRWCGRCS